jgi:hypothetical protein
MVYEPPSSDGRGDVLKVPQPEHCITGVPFTASKGPVAKMV